MRPKEIKVQFLLGILLAVIGLIVGGASGMASGLSIKTLLIRTLISSSFGGVLGFLMGSILVQVIPEFESLSLKLGKVEEERIGVDYILPEEMPMGLGEAEDKLNVEDFGGPEGVADAVRTLMADDRKPSVR
ncbi:MAG: hypothetical protein ACUVXI_04865 [bacterium]